MAYFSNSFRVEVVNGGIYTSHGEEQDRVKVKYSREGKKYEVDAKLLCTIRYYENISCNREFKVLNVNRFTA